MLQPQVEALLNIRVIDTDASSYRRHSAISILDSDGIEKVYRSAVEDRRRNFRTFV